MEAVKFVDASQCVGHDSMCFHTEYNSYVSYASILGGHVAYITVILLLLLFMKGRKPYHLKFPMMVYNVAQIALSSVIAVRLAPFLQFGFFNINGRFCREIEFWIFFHYCTKFLDMFDTVFIVLRKKDDQVSFLHLYHHFTIGCIWGALLHNGIANGTAFFGAWINSSVHALMYTHYLYTSFGYRNPFKKYLTQIQMIQFALCILQAVLVVLFDNQIPSSWAVLQLTYHMSLLYLFLQFYRRSAGMSKRPKKATTH